MTHLDEIVVGLEIAMDVPHRVHRLHGLYQLRRVERRPLFLVDTLLARQTLRHASARKRSHARTHMRWRWREVHV